jgi:hypothetical protein
MMNRIAFSASLVAAMTLGANAETLTWTGAGDGASFGQAANWSGTPTGGTLDINALVDDFVIDDPAAVVGGTGGVAQLSWVTGSGSLTMSAGTMTGATGLRYTTLDFSGGVMTRQFFLEVAAVVSGTAELRLNGAGNPLSASTVEVQGADASVVFINETPEAFRAEHLTKFTFDGLPPIEGVTFTVESDGGAGCVVRSLGGEITPQDLTWTGAGDGESFADAANWSGTPTGGSINLTTLVDRFTINDGLVGGEFGVLQMYFLADGELVMTGGTLSQGVGAGTQGITGGAVTMTGGTLNRQFLSGLGASISGTAAVNLAGGADPLPFGTTVDMSGADCSITFTNETAADFEIEHLAKITVDGEPAEIGVNLQVDPVGKTGCTITVIVAASCPADLNGDGEVNGADLGLMIGNWGACAGCQADLNGDGIVNGADFGLLIAAWGVCP